MKKRHQQKLVLLSISLMLLWNIPLMMLFNYNSIILGFPLFYFCIFASWAAATAAIFFIIKKYDR